MDSSRDREPNRVDPRGDEALTLFLAGSECPLRCVFCDLSRYTLETATPEGAIPEQIRVGLREAGDLDPSRTTLKLYNASNFFEDRAVPPRDDDEILARIEPFRRVVVECHPRWLGRRFERYVERLGDRLEIAAGLETCHPGAFARLGKGTDLARFDEAISSVTARGATLRLFVLIGAPFVPPTEAERWVVASVEHAARLGARFVSLIPLRASERLERVAPEAEPPTLREVESAADASLSAVGTEGPIVEVDPWDLEPLAACPACRTARIARIAALAAMRRSVPPVECAACAPKREGEQ